MTVLFLSLEIVSYGHVIILFVLRYTLLHDLDTTKGECVNLVCSMHRPALSDQAPFLFALRSSTLNAQSPFLFTRLASSLSCHAYAHANQKPPPLEALSGCEPCYFCLLLTSSITQPRSSLVPFRPEQPLSKPPSPRSTCPGGLSIRKTFFDKPHTPCMSHAWTT